MKYWDKPLADARMLIYALKGSRLAKMGFTKPFKARCNTCTPPQTEEFYTEGAAKKWGSDHQMLKGHDHTVHYAMKASVQTK